ncbi:MAG: nicotinate (nicotinamide) nucleotide adenylyltransferase, partial [Acutalibacteraceae bacterium]|nr:nicotinate (nicotinamide) nucleotide adenylyltransferase [Acutalibacteraceae bacterium]
MKIKIGIFGGTFNPPHKGHTRLANEAVKTLGFDKMLIIPSCIPPHKIPGKLASGEDRLEMCRLAFEDDVFEISSMELERGNRSYTVETLRELKKIYPDDELYFIIGSDMLSTFTQWYCWEEILSLSYICAASRENGYVPDLSVYTDEQKKRFVLLDAEPLEVSSTQLRNLIANDEECGLIDKKV